MNLREFIQSLARRPQSVPKLKVYESFDQALSDSHTYEDPGVIEIVSRKTAAFRKMLGATSVKRVDSHQMVQNMFVLSYVFQDRELDVLELGGACGAVFLELNKLLPGRIRRWHIVETPPMVVIGRESFQEEKLAFYDDLRTAVSGLNNLDLLIAQGVLQYLREPFLQLGDLLDLGFEYVYVTRTLVAHDRG
jgi:putative methyltransferase (TIGR04325 family)